MPLRPQFISAIDGTPLAGLLVKACAASDDACTSPLPGTAPTTDAEGRADAKLYSGFNGYLELTGPEGASYIPAPTLSYMRALDKNNPPKLPALELYSKPFLDAIVGSIDRTFEEKLGILFFIALDCEGNPAADVQVRAEPIAQETYAFYTDKARTPSITQQVTSADGAGGFVNLAPGRVVVTASRVGGGQIARAEFVIREGSITDVLLDPRR